MVVEDQLDFLPGGVQLTLTGRVLNGSTEGKIVSNQITMSSTNVYNVVPLGSGESIG